MQSQTINEQARRRYQQFEEAINTTRLAVDELTALSKKMREGGGGNRFEGWQVPTKAEVTAALRKASADLDTLRQASIEYKAELLSRAWRV
ncbi:hypothetical protein HFP15_10535 [Amycolatopsis sp. K13G38]|uniref:WXG100 family type VII secretion target n=1 Tax=Amycolatopsis acididurans TaxID=2724524 RepID=A0ABX1J0M5_9PSEU|nr:hypothetical protein [Amycolatopsis acididurans]NKQ53318.1 hypothetical protein [Amycolatopsis acididurans]